MHPRIHPLVYNLHFYTAWMHLKIPISTSLTYLPTIGAKNLAATYELPRQAELRSASSRHASPRLESLAKPKLLSTQYEGARELGTAPPSTAMSAQASPRWQLRVVVDINCVSFWFNPHLGLPFLDCSTSTHIIVLVTIS